MAQETISSKERASLARQEKAKALQGLFNNCFMPASPKEEGEAQNQSEVRRFEIRPSENRQPENRPSENRPSEIRQSKNRPSEFRPSEFRQPENRRTENRPSKNEQPENRPSENRQPKNEQPENGRSEIRQFIKSPLYGRLISLVQEIGLSSIGLLAILMEEFPSGEGRINFQHFANACSMSKSALKAQIHTLERMGLIELGATQNTGENAGRNLKITFLLK